MNKGIKTAPARKKPSPPPASRGTKAKAGEALTSPAKGAVEGAVVSEATPKSGMSKAQAMGTAVAIHGWRMAVETPVPETVAATFTRGEEVLKFSWTNGVMDESSYHFLGRSVLVRNASDAKKLMARSIEEATDDTQAIITRKKARGEPRARRAPGEKPEARILRRKIPWGENPTDEEILKAVKGKRIVWRNSISGGYDEGFVYQDGAIIQKGKVITNRYLAIGVTRDGKRVLNWTSADGGFRSVRIENIVQVRR